MVLNYTINSCNLCPVIILKLISKNWWKEPMLNKDFALILIEICFLPMNTSERQIVPWVLAGLHFSVLSGFEKHLIDLRQSLKQTASRVRACIPNWKQVQLKTEVIKSSEKYLCNGNPDSLLRYCIFSVVQWVIHVIKWYESLICYCIPAWECGLTDLHLSLKQSEYVAVCLKRSHF